MCLVVLAIDQSPDYPLILAANRDEFHARPTTAARWWADRPHILGGRDLQAGGTWLALSRDGRFATVTNYQDALPVSSRLRSRGFLVTDFLETNASPLQYAESIDGAAYAGFNLIVGDANSVAYVSNRDSNARELAPGIYGLSNSLLDGSWYKVETSKRKLLDLLQRQSVNDSSLIRLLSDRRKAPVSEVDTEFLDFERAHAITAPFIVTPDYGTRCTTVVIADQQARWMLTERRFDATGKATGDSRFRFDAVDQPLP